MDGVSITYGAIVADPTLPTAWCLGFSSASIQKGIVTPKLTSSTSAFKVTFDFYGKNTSSEESFGYVAYFISGSGTVANQDPHGFGLASSTYLAGSDQAIKMTNNNTWNSYSAIIQLNSTPYVIQVMLEDTGYFSKYASNDCYFKNLLIESVPS